MGLFRGRAKHKPPIYFVRNVATALGLVLVWRAIWQILDAIDYVLLGGSHWFTAIVGLVIGLALLYLPDRDLKELQRM
jgi:membrane associated rhomboid family serine protease